MPLQTSGQISLNDIHVEVGGPSISEVSFNDTDVRNLISSTAGTEVGMDDFYGASSGPAATVYYSFVASGFTTTPNGVQYPNGTQTGDIVVLTWTSDTSATNSNAMAGAPTQTDWVFGAAGYGQRTTGGSKNRRTVRTRTYIYARIVGDETTTPPINSSYWVNNLSSGAFIGCTLLTFRPSSSVNTLSRGTYGQTGSYVTSAPLNYFSNSPLTSPVIGIGVEGFSLQTAPTPTYIVGADARIFNNNYRHQVYYEIGDSQNANTVYWTVDRSSGGTQGVSQYIYGRATFYAQ